MKTTSLQRVGIRRHLLATRSTSGVYSASTLWMVSTTLLDACSALGGEPVFERLHGSHGRIEAFGQGYPADALPLLGEARLEDRDRSREANSSSGSYRKIAYGMSWYALIRCARIRQGRGPVRDRSGGGSRSRSCHHPLGVLARARAREESSTRLPATWYSSLRNWCRRRARARHQKAASGTASSRVLRRPCRGSSSLLASRREDTGSYAPEGGSSRTPSAACP